MSTDMYGWVEIRVLEANAMHGDVWESEVVVRRLANREYEVWGWLFGVQGDEGSRPPIAPSRGLPADVADMTKTDYAAARSAHPHELHSTTWITWAEIASIDWDERVDDRMLEYPNGDDSMSLMYAKSWFAANRETRWQGYVDELRPGVEWMVGEQRYRVVRQTRRDLLSPEMALLFQIMELLASRFGPEGVRMVVWFID